VVILRDNHVSIFSASNHKIDCNMGKGYKTFIAIGILSVLCMSCIKLVSENIIPIVFTGTPDTISTSLKVTVTNKSLSGVKNAIVSLYPSINDWYAHTNKIGASLTTDSAGTVTFKNLLTVKYYVYAELGCQNNLWSGYMLPQALVKDSTARFTTHIEPFGKLYYNNTTSSAYNVYVNGNLHVTLAAGESRYINMAAATYTIRILQIANVPKPDDRTFVGILNCGEIFSVPF